MAAGQGPRDYDLILWGATGFTGQLAVAAMAGHSAPFYSCRLPNEGTPRGGGAIRYALAGRSEEKLRKVRSECGCGPGVDILVAAADDEATIAAFVRRAKVVVSMAGPFKLYSDVLVGQCAKSGTHYVDITGEVPWVRSVIDRYDEVARSTGAVICSCCGFDSIPFDLGALFAINHLRRSCPGATIRRTTAYIVSTGVMSGGSVATGVSNQRQQVQLTKGVDPDDPFLLGGLPRGGARDEDTDSSTHAVQTLGEDVYCGPSVMHSVNSRVVRRSAGLLGWGPNFNYAELTPAPSRPVAEKLARAQRSPAPPEVIERLIAEGRLPKPGEGPTPKVRKSARFVAILDCVADGGSGLVATVRGGEAGYEETARMVLEAGLALVQEPEACPGVASGGCLTPAVALGETLVRRLCEVGMPFAVEQRSAAEVAQEALGGMAASKL